MFKKQTKFDYNTNVMQNKSPIPIKSTEIKEKPARKEKKLRKNEKEDVSRIMPLTDENKEKNAENLKKARKNDEKTEPW